MAARSTRLEFVTTSGVISLVTQQSAEVNKQRAFGDALKKHLKLLGDNWTVATRDSTSVKDPRLCNVDLTRSAGNCSVVRVVVGSGIHAVSLLTEEECARRVCVVMKRAADINTSDSKKREHALEIGTLISIEGDLTSALEDALITSHVLRHWHILHWSGDLEDSGDGVLITRFVKPIFVFAKPVAWMNATRTQIADALFDHAMNVRHGKPVLTPWARRVATVGDLLMSDTRDDGSLIDILPTIDAISAISDDTWRAINAQFVGALAGVQARLKYFQHNNPRVHNLLLEPVSKPTFFYYPCENRKFALRVSLTIPMAASSYYGTLVSNFAKFESSSLDDDKKHHVPTVQNARLVFIDNLFATFDNDKCTEGQRMYLPYGTSLAEEALRFPLLDLFYFASDILAFAARIPEVKTSPWWGNWFDFLQKYIPINILNLAPDAVAMVDNKIMLTKSGFEDLYKFNAAKHVTCMDVVLNDDYFVSFRVPVTNSSRDHHTATDIKVENARFIFDVQQAATIARATEMHDRKDFLVSKFNDLVKSASSEDPIKDAEKWSTKLVAKVYHDVDLTTASIHNNVPFGRPQ